MLVSLLTGPPSGWDDQRGLPSMGFPRIAFSSSNSFARIGSSSRRRPVFFSLRLWPFALILETVSS